MTDTTPERIWVRYSPNSHGAYVSSCEPSDVDDLDVAFVHADIHAAVVAERDNARARADATERAFGELASKVPLPEVIRATGTVGDFAAWFCEVVAERDQMKAAMKEIMRHCPDKATRLEACKALEKNDE